MAGQGLPDPGRRLTLIEAIDLIRDELDNQLPESEDPAHWYKCDRAIINPSDNDAGDNNRELDAIVRQRKINDRCRLILSHALLRGELTGHFDNGKEWLRMPGWLWTETRPFDLVSLGGKIAINPFLSDEWRRWSGIQVYINRPEFDTWLEKSDIRDAHDFPDLPEPYDLGSKPSEIDSRPPSDSPFVSLSEALTWIAFGISLTPAEIAYAEQYQFGPYAHDGWQDKMRKAVQRFSEEASGGNLEVRGRYLGKYSDHAEAKEAKTRTLSNEELRDFALFDSLYGGLEFGTGIAFDGSQIESSNRVDGWRDVEVRREDLVKFFPLKIADARIPPNRQLNHEKIIGRAWELRLERPDISKGSAAASIVAELPLNPKTRKPRDTRHIERLIAYLWEGNVPESPP